MNKQDALQWIENNPLFDGKAVDVDAVTKLGIEIRLRPNLRGVQGMLLGNQILAIDSRLNMRQRIFVFGHEIGHFFCLTHGYPNYHYPDNRARNIEAFCDWFATQLTGFDATIMEDYNVRTT